MPGDDRQSKVEYYRTIADSLHRLAGQTRYSEMRQDLFDMAEAFDRMAERIEKRQTIEL